jgi:hypothetical protein
VQYRFRDAHTAPLCYVFDGRNAHECYRGYHRACRRDGRQPGLSFTMERYYPPAEWGINFIGPRRP